MAPASRDARPSFRLAGSLVLAAALIGALGFAAIYRLKADLQQAKADATAAQSEAREAKATAAEAKSAATAAAGELELLSTAYRELQTEKSIPLPLADRFTPGRDADFAPPPPHANVRGTVKARRAINGVGYATISVGSAQNIIKGMQFKVIDAGNFLGYLTVVNVEADESVGSFTGPGFDKVKPGSEVRPQ
jgi:hypothetical protein